MKSIWRIQHRIRDIIRSEIITIPYDYQNF
jgi:hypothetical protein